MKHDEAPSARTPLVLVVLAAFAAGLAGGLVAQWVRGESPEPPAQPATARGEASTAQVTAELRALTAAVEKLARLPATGAEPAGSGARGPEPLAPESGAAGPAFDAALARLVDALGTAGPRAALADRDSLTLPPDPLAARSKLFALRSREAADVKHEHVLMTMQDVVERYGIPDRVSVDHPIVYLIWTDADGKSIQFRTYDGIVVGTELPR